MPVARRSVGWRVVAYLSRQRRLEPNRHRPSRRVAPFPSVARLQSHYVALSLRHRWMCSGSGWVDAQVRQRQQLALVPVPTGPFDPDRPASRWIRAVYRAVARLTSYCPSPRSSCSELAVRQGRRRGDQLRAVGDLAVSCPRRPAGRRPGPPTGVPLLAVVVQIEGHAGCHALPRTPCFSVEDQRRGQVSGGVTCNRRQRLTCD